MEQGKHAINYTEFGVGVFAGFYTIFVFAWLLPGKFHLLFSLHFITRALAVTHPSTNATQCCLTLITTLITTANSFRDLWCQIYHQIQARRVAYWAALSSNHQGLFNNFCIASFCIFHTFHLGGEVGGWINWYDNHLSLYLKLWITVQGFILYPRWQYLYVSWLRTTSKIKLICSLVDQVSRVLSCTGINHIRRQWQC